MRGQLSDVRIIASSQDSFDKNELSAPETVLPRVIDAVYCWILENVTGEGDEDLGRGV